MSQKASAFQIQNKIEYYHPPLCKKLKLVFIQYRCKHFLSLVKKIASKDYKQELSENS